MFVLLDFWLLDCVVGFVLFGLLAKCWPPSCATCGKRYAIFPLDQKTNKEQKQTLAHHGCFFGGVIPKEQKLQPGMPLLHAS